MVPGARQVRAEVEQFLSPLGRHARLVLRICALEVGFDPRDRGQPFVPAPFEFADDQSVAGVYGVELPVRPGRLETCLLEGELDLVTLGMTLVGTLLDGAKCGLDANRS
jgi:hypothetical protein